MVVVPVTAKALFSSVVALATGPPARRRRCSTCSWGSSPGPRTHAEGRAPAPCGLRRLRSRTRRRADEALKAPDSAAAAVTMHGPAVAAWVRRHSPEDRLRGALELADAAVAQAVEHARRSDPGGGPREVRAWIRSRLGGS